jgi:hypothetical protein
MFETGKPPDLCPPLPQGLYGKRSSSVMSSVICLSTRTTIIGWESERILVPSSTTGKRSRQRIMIPCSGSRNTDFATTLKPASAERWSRRETVHPNTCPETRGLQDVQDLCRGKISEPCCDVFSKKHSREDSNRSWVVDINIYCRDPPNFQHSIVAHHLQNSCRDKPLSHTITCR